MPRLLHAVCADPGDAKGLLCVIPADQPWCSQQRWTFPASRPAATCCSQSMSCTVNQSADWGVGVQSGLGMPSSLNSVNSRCTLSRSVSLYCTAFVHLVCRCKGMMYLAEVVSGDEWSVPVCLACALAYPLQGTCPFRIQLHPDLTHLENVAQSFEQLLRQPKPQDSCAGSAIFLTCGCGYEYAHGVH